MQRSVTMSSLFALLIGLPLYAPPTKKKQSHSSSLQQTSRKKAKPSQKRFSAPKKSAAHSQKAISPKTTNPAPSTRSSTESATDTNLQKESSPHHHKAQQEQLRALKATISSLVHKVDKKASVGVKVVLLKNHSTLYEKNADQLFTPASNTKLITAAAAYHILGPEHQFTTKIFTNKKVSQHVIHNLYIKGAGDPSLTSKDLVQLAKRLRKLGIYDIRGNIIVDTSLFQNERAHAPGWSSGDGPIYDKAPTGAFMVDHSCIRVKIKPARVPGRRPLVTIEHYTDYIHARNEAKTLPAGKDSSLHVLHGEGNNLIIRGSIGKHCKTQHFRLAVAQPDLYAGQVFAEILKEQNIHLHGTVKIGTVADKARFLLEHTSEPLNDLIRHLMKNSDNLYADALFRLMGSEVTKNAGSWATGKQAIEHFLQTEVGLDITNMSINDGSGLSHKNKISPHHFIQLLTWMYTTSPHKDNFIASLPIGGVDGNLRNRMKEAIPHAVKAKTGSLNGVTCLSGYITPKTGLPLIFVIMVNRKNKSALIFKRKLEDQLCTILAAHAFSSS